MLPHAAISMLRSNSKSDFVRCFLIASPKVSATDTPRRETVCHPKRLGRAQRFFHHHRRVCCRFSMFQCLFRCRYLDLYCLAPCSTKGKGLRELFLSPLSISSPNPRFPASSSAFYRLPISDVASCAIAISLSFNAPSTSHASLCRPLSRWDSIEVAMSQ